MPARSKSKRISTGGSSKANKATKQSAQKKATAKKPITKKPVVKKPPAKVIPPVGPFGNRLLQNLKNASPGTPHEVVIMETLNSIPPDQLKAALNKATPQERNLLFGAIPSDQIKSLIGSLPTTVLAPSNPPAPPPSPANGPPASILMTTYENVPFPKAQNDPNWAEKLTGGNTVHDWRPLGGNVIEWTSVYDNYFKFEKEGSLNNPMVGLTGWAMEHRSDTGDIRPLSDSDIWFTHPFGNDFEFFIIPDPQYQSLLGAHNTGRDATGKVLDKEYNGATQLARDKKTFNLPAERGVLGVETDVGLVPLSFRNLIKDGTRIATFGRWIVDCGHNDFHTEIHPPLLMAVAMPAPPPAGVQGASEMTSVQIMSRPYTVSQRFSEGNFIDHLVQEVKNVQSTTLGFPDTSWRVEAHPTVLTPPYDGRPYIKLLVQPPPRKRGDLVPHPLPRPQRLMVSYHFTHRTGVAVRLFDAGNGTVGMIIVLGDLSPAPLPPKQDNTISWDQLGEYSWLVDLVIDGLTIEDILRGNIITAYNLNKGILTDFYNPLNAFSFADNKNVVSAVRVDQIQPGAGLSENNGDGETEPLQPFPIYGWLNVWWEDEPPIVKK